MLAPKLMPHVEWPGASDWPAIGFIPNAGDTVMVSVPRTLAPTTSVFSPVICVAGFRRFMINSRVPTALGQAEWILNALDPYNHARVISRLILGDTIQQDGLTCINWGGLAINPDGQEELSSPVFKLEVRNNQLDPGTLDRFDGLWCAAA